MRFETTARTVDGRVRTTTAADQRRNFNAFMETGKSGVHSEYGVTLAPLLNELFSKQIPFVLRYEPGGFIVEKK